MRFTIHMACSFLLQQNDFIPLIFLSLQTSGIAPLTQTLANGYKNIPHFLFYAMTSDKPKINSDFICNMKVAAVIPCASVWYGVVHLRFCSFSHPYCTDREQIQSSSLGCPAPKIPILCMYYRTHHAFFIANFQSSAYSDVWLAMLSFTFLSCTLSVNKVHFCFVRLYHKRRIKHGCYHCIHNAGVILSGSAVQRKDKCRY